ncbi:TetR/AcrR family transcriptional regulator [Methylovirgula sp. 4M-Z18]|uniref:TetR/AcrR family transcriptional regulator n=1 Tax=Methylovirgula sp. 4M-Z18 TaxID=2293567 RepID=UPI000E2E59DC|nr:TetR/AcrR family transcriptional regulator [Methylovirgula sp. 4M-Z18]RFB81269.1 TetR/AcrR family transcriptional regulator [Methylovirgula sp. 4M-Z18]
MRYSTEHKEQTRTKILDAAARRFRAEGYDGLGIDGLAKAAGVTNGAFYGHFASKADAFREVAAQGLAELRQGIEHYRAERGESWLADFVHFYYSAPKLDCPEDICGLPSFAPEVARAPEETRAAFEAQLRTVAEAVAAGLPGDAKASEDKAWIVLAMLAGGVTLARSVNDLELKKRMTSALEAAVIQMGSED